MRGGHRAEVRVELRRRRVCGELVAWVKFGTPRFISCLATALGLSLLIFVFWRLVNRDGEVLSVSSQGTNQCVERHHVICILGEEYTQWKMMGLYLPNESLVMK